MNLKNTTYYWRVTAFDPYADRMTTTKTYHFTTLASPQISNIAATPSDVLPATSVNITAVVIDGTTVDTVRVNIKPPTGSAADHAASGGDPGWTVLTYDDFESGMGSYTDGGSSCSLYNGAEFSYQGNRAVELQDFQGLVSSFYHYPTDRCGHPTVHQHQSRFLVHHSWHVESVKFLGEVLRWTTLVHRR